MPTRHYFRKAVEPAPKPPKVRRPNHRGKIVLVEVTPGHWRTMASRDYARLLGNSKGGLTTQARGTAHTWTSEEATKAIKKCWAKRWSKGRRIGVRVGRPAKLRPAVDKVALRLQYSIHIHKSIWYSELDQCWYNCSNWVTGDIRRISETQALRRLGHLAGMSKVVPHGKVIHVSKPKESV